MEVLSDRLADVFKEKANKCFSDGNFTEAINLYSKAIDIEESAIYYANRSFAYLKTELFGAALEDATKSISIDENYSKGYYRRASAYMALGQYDKALADFESVVRRHPYDKSARCKYDQCLKRKRMGAFVKAISGNEGNSPLDNLDNSTPIESTYGGPHLEQNENNSYYVTKQFIIELLDTYKTQKKLHKKYAMILLQQFRNYVRELPSLVEITVPEDSKFTVCGDIHGQFYDLLNIFDLNGLPSEDNPYLFNGDFVDRGSFSVECIFTLISFKLLYPNHFYMSRGNHESEYLNQMYGFEGEVKSKYNQQMVDVFTEVFNCLPLTHLINKRVLVMHGGLFREDGVTLSQIKSIDRFRQPPDSGLMCELLWSDPMKANGRSPSKRGIGCQFGPDVTEAFCIQNNLDFIIRSHEVKDEGYEVAHSGRCITVFSAPNYCDTMQNKGAFIIFRRTTETGKMLPEFTSFKEVPHPKVRPLAYANSLLSLLA